jgi:hypothetical protein
MIFSRSKWWLAFLTLAALGCGGVSDRPALYPVSGTVVYKGKPVEGAQVSFFHEKAQRAAEGKTDAEGKFVLSMFDYNDGAMPGENVVTIDKIKSAPAAASTDTSRPPNPADLAKMGQEFGGGDPSKKKGADNELPAKYASRTTTPVKQTVTDQENKFVIELAD